MSILIFGFTVAEVVEFRAAGLSIADIRAIGEASPETGTPVVEAVTPKAKAPRKAKAPNAFYTSVIAARVPCAYGVTACGRFAPKGVGSHQHTTCRKGKAAMKAAR